MDVTRELRAAQRRVEAQIQRNVDEALIRLGFDPVAERKAAAEAAAEAARQTQIEAMREVVQRFRGGIVSILDAFQAAAAPLTALAQGIAGGSTDGRG